MVPAGSCERCLAALSANAKFCPACGQAVEPLIFMGDAFAYLMARVEQVLAGQRRPDIVAVTGAILSDVETVRAYDRSAPGDRFAYHAGQVIQVEASLHGGGFNIKRLRMAKLKQAQHIATQARLATASNPSAHPLDGRRATLANEIEGFLAPDTGTRICECSKCRSDTAALLRRW